MQLRQRRVLANEPNENLVVCCKLFAIADQRWNKLAAMVHVCTDINHVVRDDYAVLFPHADREVRCEIESSKGRCCRRRAVRQVGKLHVARNDSARPVRAIGEIKRRRADTLGWRDDTGTSCRRVRAILDNYAKHIDIRVGEHH